MCNRREINEDGHQGGVNVLTTDYFFIKCLDLISWMIRDSWRNDVLSNACFGCSRILFSNNSLVM